MAATLGNYREAYESSVSDAAQFWLEASTSTKHSYTYGELLLRVRQFAGALRAQGVEKGDRVLIYLPMIPHAIIAMLACARIGAVHSVVFGGFAAGELAVRIDDASPKVIVTASGGFEPGRSVEYLPIVDEALKLSKGSVKSVIVKERPSITTHRSRLWRPRSCIALEHEKHLQH